MEYKLIIYPETEAKEIVDIYVDPWNIKPGLVFYYEGKKWKVLDAKFYARKAKYNERGSRIYDTKPDDVINPLTDTLFPEIVVTEIPLY